MATLLIGNPTTGQALAALRQRARETAAWEGYSGYRVIDHSAVRMNA